MALVPAPRRRVLIAACPVPTGPSFHTSRPPVPSPLGRRPARRAAARRPRSAHHSRRWPSARLQNDPAPRRSRPGYRIAAPLRHRVPRDYRATGLPSPRARPGYRGLSGRYPGRTVPPTLSVRLDTRARHAPPRPPRRRLSQDASPGPAHRDGPRPDSTGHTTTHISMVPSTYRTTTNVAHSTSYHTQYASTGYMGCYVQGHLYRDGVPTSLHIWNPLLRSRFFEVANQWSRAAQHSQCAFSVSTECFRCCQRPSSSRAERGSTKSGEARTRAP